jgi:spore coat polysaccharide biosynthesis protein SpsF
LEIATIEASAPSHREHVTPFIYQQPERFRLGSYQNEEDLSHLRWTVDEVSDLDLVEKIYSCLYPHNPNFNMLDILNWLDLHSEWKSYNTRYKRNEGLTKSLIADSQFL